jgi:hypothetical protein
MPLARIASLTRASLLRLVTRHVPRANESRNCGTDDGQRRSIGVPTGLDSREPRAACQAQIWSGGHSTGWSE